MTSVGRGARTLAAEVTNVSVNGFWLLMDDQELFVAFSDFPWFRDATIAQLTQIERPSAHHLYWPELDVDLAADSIATPERYPLVSKARPNTQMQLTSARTTRLRRKRARS